MIRPFMDIVRFDANDVIATSLEPVPVRVSDIFLTNTSIVNYNNYSDSDINIAMVNVEQYTGNDVYQVFRLMQIADGYIAGRADGAAPTLTIGKNDTKNYNIVYNWLQTGEILMRQ